MMRWNRGRAEIDQMLRTHDLERVPPSREHADHLIIQARKDLESADADCDANPVRAYATLYDAARMALTAVLENEGLRTTAKGGHKAPYEALMAQLDPPAGPKLRPFDRMRRTRHQSEYPTFDRPDVTARDVRADLPHAATIVDLCADAKMLDGMSPY